MYGLFTFYSDCARRDRSQLPVPVALYQTKHRKTTATVNYWFYYG